MRHLRFPLIDGNLKSKKAVKAATDALQNDLMGLVLGISPVFDAVPGFPKSDTGQVSAFEDTLADLSESKPTRERSARPLRTSAQRASARCWRSTASGRRRATPWPSSCCAWFATT